MTLNRSAAQNMGGAVHHDAGLVCKIAETVEEWSAAFSLVYQRYLASGLIDPNPFGMRVLPHHLLVSTNTFIAIQNGEVVCTATLITDSPDGLPIEAIFPAEVERERMQGTTLGEVSCLASNIVSARTFFSVFLPLLRVLTQHGRRFGVDELVVACHPKHARLYERSMGYQEFAEQTTYGSLHDAPVVGISLNFEDADRSRPPCYDAVFDHDLPLMDLLPRPMPPEITAHFAQMVDTRAAYVPMFS